MHILIESTLRTLEKTKVLLHQIDNNSLTNKSIAPYYSSIGSHVRHILDFYNCILTNDDVFDLTLRQRDIEIESDCQSALNYLNELVNKLNSLDYSSLEKIIEIEDDLGLGKVSFSSTYAALLAQANSHTIHHYAIINYILEGLHLTLADDSFGYNPTTPKTINLN
jgi:hypothetical protein